MMEIKCQRTSRARPVGKNSNRQGAIMVLVAVMLIVIFACTALCIDIGWGSLTKNELRNSADAAASAGVAQLMGNYGKYSSPTTSNRADLITASQASAMTYSVKYAGYNKAGDVSSLKLLPQDVQFGFTDASGNYQANYAGYPNTVKLTIRRDNTANSPLPLFFAPVLGTSSLSLTATSSATAYVGLISSFNPNGGGEGSSFNPTSSTSGSGGSGGGSGGSGSGSGGSGSGSGSSGSGSGSGGYGGWGTSYSNSSSSLNCTLLPIAFDVNDWNQFFATGVSPDGSIYRDSSNVPQIKVYPSPKNSPGNFGLLDIGPWTNATPVYANWVLNGPSTSDLQYLVDNGFFPVSQAAPKAWKGSPGLRTTLASYFTQIIGQPRLLPLFQPAAPNPYQAASGSGSNTTYAIVGFVGVKVNYVNGAGSNLVISVQPCDVIDATAVFDSTTVYPVGAEPANQLKSFAHPPSKFTK